MMLNKLEQNKILLRSVVSKKLKEKGSEVIGHLVAMDCK